MRWLAVLALTAAAIPGRAEVLVYSLEIRDHEATTYVLAVPVAHPGTLRVAAEWGGSRVVSLRLEGPGEPPVKARRAGPSPLVLEVEVGEDQDPGQGAWTLFVRALPAGGDADATLTVELPGEPPPPPAPPATPSAIPEETKALPAAEPWALPAPAPGGASDAVVRIHEAVETFRGWVMEDPVAPRHDACGWHVDVLRYLAAQRDALGRDAKAPSETTRRYLARLAEAVRRVEALRTSDDPILAGPVPEDPLRRRAWLAVRRRTTDPLEAELDALASDLRRGHVPELANQRWPARFLACLTACERHFEQRVRLGEEQAPSSDLARDQWDGLRLSSGALLALASSAGTPPSLASAADSGAP